MLDALTVATILQVSPPPPIGLDELVRSASHVVLLRVTALHDVHDDAASLAVREVIEANISRVLKGPSIGPTVFVPFDLWWRPDITSIRIGDEAIVFLKASVKFPLSPYAMRELRQLKGASPAIGGARSHWGYFPIINETAVASGGIILGMRAKPWTPGHVSGPSVVDLEELIIEIERLVGSRSPGRPTMR
jgi:hypothetical protein